MLIRGAASAAFLLAACGVRDTPPEPDIPPSAISVPFASLADLPTSSVVNPSSVVVKTRAEWQDLWGAATASLEPAPELPLVDFGKRMVLVVALGRRPTGGFSVHLGSMYEDSERLYAVYTETSPGPGCLTTQGFSAPLAAISIPSSGKPVRFIKRTSVLRCN
ncbi:MAG: protease complex subunit PrcB family protein [Gemmatimonadota bacterium]|nr:MAG: protease complex subunit PrcB family protein [Gemmatimonadota bacterium]